MSAFDTCSRVEDQGVALLLPWLDEQAQQHRVVRIAKGALAKALQQIVGDFLMTTRDGGMSGIELKVEQQGRDRLFLETWSNRNLETRERHAEIGSNVGWLYKSRADVLLYYFLSTDELYALSMFRLQQWAFGAGDVPPRLYAFPEVGQSKYRQMNDTRGRPVSIDLLRREVGLKKFSVRQLAFAETTGTHNMTDEPDHAVWSGFLQRTETGVRATLVDTFGMVTEILGVPETRDGIKGYALTARLLSVPTSLKLPVVDDDR